MGRSLSGPYSWGDKHRQSSMTSPELASGTYEFDGDDVLAASGATVSIPAGAYLVEKRSLVYRVRVGGREVDLTLGEFERLLRSDRVKPSSETPAAD